MPGDGLLLGGVRVFIGVVPAGGVLWSSELRRRRVGRSMHFREPHCIEFGDTPKMSIEGCSSVACIKVFSKAGEEKRRRESPSERVQWSSLEFNENVVRVAILPSTGTADSRG